MYFLASYRANLFVVVAFRMLPAVVWQMPELGTFNLHASLLPQYRGAAPINFAIINGETETGLTTFFLNEEIDKGAVIMREKVSIRPDETAVYEDAGLAIRTAKKAGFHTVGVYDPYCEDWEEIVRTADEVITEWGD